MIIARSRFRRVSWWNFQVCVRHYKPPHTKIARDYTSNADRMEIKSELKEKLRVLGRSRPRRDELPPIQQKLGYRWISQCCGRVPIRTIETVVFVKAFFFGSVQAVLWLSIIVSQLLEATQLKIRVRACTSHAARNCCIKAHSAKHMEAQT